MELTLITAVISIVSIIVIGLVITPMLTFVEARRFNTLEFFSKISQERLKELISAGEYLLSIHECERFDEICQE
jgi:hypothetical protein